jgi:hypothetical protein
MSFRVTHSLDDFPEHRALITEMLLGYSTIEFFTMDLVGKALGDAGHTRAGRILYRVRGAETRLNIVDAIARPIIEALDLIGPYGQWLGAMRKCRVIRNQYAHCGWHNEHGTLVCESFDTMGDSFDGIPEVFSWPTDLSLLREQSEFFEYTLAVLTYVIGETRYRLDPHEQNPFDLPKSRAAPNLRSPRDSQTH